MAKQEKTSPERGKIKFRVVEIELEGSAHNLHEGMRAIANALSNNGTNRQQINMNPGKTNIPVLDTTPTSDEEPSTDFDIDSVTMLTEPNLSKPAPKKKSVPPTPNLLNDEDFNSGEISLKAYCSQKNPTQQNEKYLVVAGWYKEQKSQDSISPDHIYTAFKFLKWKCPNDVRGGFKNAQHHNQWFQNKGANQWVLTIIGLNRLEEMDGSAS